jgi:hypothetical protein
MSEAGSTFDDFFGQAAVENPEHLSQETVQESSSSAEPQEELPVRDIDNPPPSGAQLIKIANEQEAFEKVTALVQERLSSLCFQTKADYDEARKKLRCARIEYEEEPNPADLSKQLAMVQVLKDEIFRVYASAHENQIVRDAAYDILKEAYPAVSQAKAADKRKAEAALILSEFALDRAQAEAFFKYCEQVVVNLESQYKAISRRIVCLEAQIKIGESQTSPVDMSFTKNSKRLIRDIMDEQKKIDSEPGTRDW